MARLTVAPGLADERADLRARGRAGLGAVWAPLAVAGVVRVGLGLHVRGRRYDAQLRVDGAAAPAREPLGEGAPHQAPAEVRAIASYGVRISPRPQRVQMRP